MQDAPGLCVLGGIDLAPEQEFADSVTDPRQVDAQVLSAANQISELLLVGLGDADQAQLAGAEQTGQAEGITLVDLDVIGRVLEDVPRRADHDVEASLTSPSDQSIAVWSRFIHGPQWLRHSSQPLEHLLRSARDSLRVDLPSRLVQHGRD